MLINTKTQTQVWEHDFRASHPDTSFPAILTDEVIRPFGYAVLHYDSPVAPAPQYKMLVPAPPVEVSGKWQAQYGTVDMSPEDIAAVDASIQAEIVNNTQSRLDKFAATKGYDSILSACTYADSSIPSFASDGKYAVQARDLVWSELYKLLDEVLSGARKKPCCFSEIEALLPELKWPVQVI